MCNKHYHVFIFNWVCVIDFMLTSLIVLLQAAWSVVLNEGACFPSGPPMSFIAEITFGVSWLSNIIEVQQSGTYFLEMIVSLDGTKSTSMDVGLEINSVSQLRVIVTKSITSVYIYAPRSAKGLFNLNKGDKLAMILYDGCLVADYFAIYHYRYGFLGFLVVPE